MSNDEHGSRPEPARKREALQWFPIHIARLMTARGYLRIASDDAALAALMRFMAHSWIHGPVEPHELESVCGPGGADLAKHMLDADDNGAWFLPYLEDCRTEQDARRLERAEAGRRGGVAKASSAKRSHSSAKQKLANSAEERREEKSTEEENKPTRAGAREGSGTPLTRWWDAEFERTRGVPYRWVRTGKDGKGCPDAVALGSLQKQGLPLEEIRQRITVFLERGLANGDTWEVQNATPRLFASRYATLGTQVKKLNKVDAQVAEILRQASEPAKDLWS